MKVNLRFFLSQSIIHYVEFRAVTYIHIFYSNASVFVDFGYNRKFMISLSKIVNKQKNIIYVRKRSF